MSPSYSGRDWLSQNKNNPTSVLKTSILEALKILNTSICFADFVPASHYSSISFSHTFSGYPLWGSVKGPGVQRMTVWHMVPAYAHGIKSCNTFRAKLSRWEFTFSFFSKNFIEITFMCHTICPKYIIHCIHRIVQPPPQSILQFFITAGRNFMPINSLFPFPSKSP